MAISYNTTKYSIQLKKSPKFSSLDILMTLEEKQKSNKMTVSNLPGTEFKAIIIKMLTELRETQ